jgi:hypothetical protein
MQIVDAQIHTWGKSCFRRRPTLLEFQIAPVAAVATLADFRVWVHLLPLQGAEIGEVHGREMP